MAFLKNSKSSVIVIAVINGCQLHEIPGCLPRVLPALNGSRCQEKCNHSLAPTLGVAVMYLMKALQSSSWLHFWKVYLSWALLLGMVYFWRAGQKNSRWVSKWMNGRPFLFPLLRALHKRQPSNCPLRYSHSLHPPLQTTHLPQSCSFEQHPPR